MHDNNVMPRRKLSYDWLKTRVTEQWFCVAIMWANQRSYFNKIAIAGTAEHQWKDNQ